MSIELCDSNGQFHVRMPIADRPRNEPGHRQRVGITPTDNRPDSEFDVFRSVSISCRSDPQLSRLVCAHFRTRHPELLFELTDAA